jgi:uncharacterized protein with PIN domain
VTDIYVDTSALVALAFAERGATGIARRLESATAVYSCNLLEAEFRSVLLREGVEDGALLEPIRWVVPDRPLSREFERVLEAGYMRGADLWHPACDAACRAAAAGAGVPDLGQATTCCRPRPGVPHILIRPG